MQRPRRIAIALGVLQIVIALILGMMFVMEAEAGALGTAIFGGLLAGVSALAALMAIGLAKQRSDGYRRLRMAMAFAVRDEMPPALPPPVDPDAAILIDQINQVAAKRGAMLARPDARLAAVIGAFPAGVVLLATSGQISLINVMAKEILGPEHATLGASIFTAVDRDALAAAIAHAEAAGRPIRAHLPTADGRPLDAEVVPLADGSGALIVLAGDTGGWLPGCDHDLAIHETPPEAPPPDEATPLDALPIVVLDTETTGLNVAKDRVVSIGAVRMHGARVFPAVAVDRLVNPGGPIPPASTAIHGITDAMVKDAAPFERVWPEVARLAEGCVMVGHNIRFDMALLRRAVARVQGNWIEPRWLCTTRLAEVLEQGETDFNLEAIARRQGLDPAFRHTALGDAILTAEVYRRLMLRFQALGVTTLGELTAQMARAKRAAAAQAESGWES